MCGISGLAYHSADRPVDRSLLRRMTDILRHRGPDSDGFYTALGIGLGVRRLSIVDLQTGDQPITNEDGSIVVVCNGEIYNHVELRQLLIAKGHRFSSASDVEVIVHLYEDHDVDFVRHLRGMFGLALWDTRRRRLVLARDRLGIKPLHYAIMAEGLFFGSEQKAILASGVVAPEPDIQALRQIFSYGRVISPRTFVSGIRRLPAGHVLTWTDGRADIRQYWDAAFPARDDYDAITTEQEWADGLRERLSESVRLHLRSDVPLGAWLSGGIDSSAVTALMSQQLPGPIPTFTLRFENPKDDECTGRKALDDYPRFHLQGHRPVFSLQDMARLPRSIWHNEDSLISGASVGQLIVAESTAARVKAVLTGEGADEILGGYSWYPALRILDPLFRLPAPARRWLGNVPAIRSRWPGAAGTICGPREMNFERFSRSVAHLRSQAYGEAIFSPHILAELGRQSEPDDAAPSPDGFDTWHPFAQMQYFDIKHRLADSVILGLDRASMAYSVEARVPFLDHEFVEFCARIPPRFKMKWLREKHILRRAMNGILPADIVRRKKWPMWIPIHEWLRGKLPPYAEELLSQAALRDAGCFDPRRVTALLQRHRQGEQHLGAVISGVLGVQTWHRLFRGGHLERGEAPCVTL